MYFMFSSASQMVIVFLWFLCAITVNLGMSQKTNVTILCNRKDQELLSMFKQGIKDPSNMLSTWSIEEDCCHYWTGVHCNNITGRVTELNLFCYQNQCLGGEINFSLFQLELLSFLDLSRNDFETIHFPNLEAAASSSPTNNSNLVHLDLSSNFKLQMDNLRWLPHFFSLKYLNLGGINLSNETLWLQWMAMLPALTELRLSGCGLNGINPFHGYGYVNFTSLALLDISMNSFHSEIPNWLFNLSSGISHLVLSSNYFRGQIPAALLNFQHLKSLNMGYNNLSGSIPEWMGQFKNLQELDLTSNLLSGGIPEAIGNLSSLIDLYLGHNFLNGNLSEQSFTKLSSLKILRLDSSAFTFNFGTHWQPPFQLAQISMRNCKLGQEFPSWLYTQRSLYRLDISNSGLSFNVENDFRSLVTQIEQLILSNNSISGDVSTMLFTGTTIDLNSNNFTGRLPRLSPKVSFFNIANNSFSGPIYPLLCQNVTGKQELQVLDMSHNLLSGEIPDCWMNWQSLLHINLEGNNLSGEIPGSMGSLTYLDSLRLRNNSLSGNIPSSLENCSLSFLDLAFNEFIGKIPRWIKSWNMVLILRSNKFSGSIPSQICQLPNLLVLDLANNNLSGPIPKCLNDITAMVNYSYPIDDFFINYYYVWGLAPTGVESYKEDLPLLVKGLHLDYSNSFQLVRIVDLSSNDLSGSIPQELFRLIALQSLNLSHNHLMGKIPSNIGQMKFLESLDLSGNTLSGEIPQSMSNLSFLSHLNLSFNNFYGRVPLSTQLQSFEVSSYIGNSELCGPPLPKSCAQQEKPNGSTQVSKGDDFKSSFKIAAGVGFASAFCGVFGTLLFTTKWRHAYFHILDSLYIFIVIKINRFRYRGH